MMRMNYCPTSSVREVGTRNLKIYQDTSNNRLADLPDPVSRLEP